MLLILLALVWLALLTPVAVRKFRDVRSDRSIESFHVEHEVLSRQGYSVAPAHRLADVDGPVAESPKRPHLTLVHPDDTYRSLESRTSWREWSEDYDFDHDHDAPRARVETANRYARAYAVHRDEPRADYYEPPLRRRSMRVQRRRVAATLVGGAFAVTAIAYVSSVGLFADLAYVAWLCVVIYVALALFALSQGYLSSAAFTRSTTRYAPALAYEDGPAADEWGAVGEGDEQWRDEFDDEWQYAPAPAASTGGRRAFG